MLPLKNPLNSLSYLFLCEFSTEQPQPSSPLESEYIKAEWKLHSIQSSFISSAKSIRIKFLHNSSALTHYNTIEKIQA